MTSGGELYFLTITTYDCWVKVFFTKAPKVRKEAISSIQWKQLEIKILNLFIRNIFEIQPRHNKDNHVMLVDKNDPF